MTSIYINYNYLNTSKKIEQPLNDKRRRRILYPSAIKSVIATAKLYIEYIINIKEKIINCEIRNFFGYFYNIKNIIIIID